MSRDTRFNSKATESSWVSTQTRVKSGRSLASSLHSRSRTGLVEEDVRSQKPSLSRQGPSIAGYYLGEVLGRGSFSTVHICRKKGTETLQAIKILSTRDLKKQGKMSTAMTERTVLVAINHPLVVSVTQIFRDSLHIYFVLDFCEGGDLSNLIEHHITQKERLSLKIALDLELARFYIAEVVLAVQELHLHGFVHRDLKAENVLVHRSGHIKLSDFGTVKDENPPKNGKSKSQLDDFVGSPGYVSPEMLKDSVCSVGADYWALGILLFQLITGKTPFEGETEQITFNLIGAHDIGARSARSSLSSTTLNMEPVDLDLQPYFSGIALPEPDRTLFDSANELIPKLLRRKPVLRLGASNNRTPKDPHYDAASNGPETLQQHRFFAGMDFENLASSQAPQVPYETNVKPPQFDGADKNWQLKLETTDLVDEFKEMQVETKARKSLGESVFSDVSSNKKMMAPKRFGTKSTLRSNATDRRKSRRLTFTMNNLQKLGRSMSHNVKSFSTLMVTRSKIKKYSNGDKREQIRSQTSGMTSLRQRLSSVSDAASAWPEVLRTSGRIRRLSSRSNRRRPVRKTLSTGKRKKKINLDGEPSLLRVSTKSRKPQEAELEKAPENQVE